MKQFISSNWETLFFCKYRQCPLGYNNNWENVFKTIEAIYCSSDVINTEFLKCPMCSSGISQHAGNNNIMERICISKCGFKTSTSFDYKLMFKIMKFRLCCKNFLLEIAGACVRCGNPFCMKCMHQNENNQLVCKKCRK